MMMLDEDKEKEEDKKQRRTGKKQTSKNIQCAYEDEKHAVEEQEQGLQTNKGNADDTNLAKGNICKAAGTKLLPSSSVAFDDHNKLKSLDVDPLDEFDLPLEGENRVLARAIEGGVEKHILTLTGDITNIGAIRYWRKTDGRSFPSLTENCASPLSSFSSNSSAQEQLGVVTRRKNKAKATTEVGGCQPHGTINICNNGAEERLREEHRMTENGNSNNSSNRSSDNNDQCKRDGYCHTRLRRPFKLFLNASRIRLNIGCSHDGDSPDPQLFSNRFIKQLDKEDDYPQGEDGGGDDFVNLPWCASLNTEATTTAGPGKKKSERRFYMIVFDIVERRRLGHLAFHILSHVYLKTYFFFA